MRFTILQESESRSVISYHEEDIKREPTLFEQAMQGFKEENSDDDLSEEEEDDSTAQESFGSKKKQAKINSDEEVEESKDD
jgi:polyhydroxyalkanoate synthesis regulator protein